MDWPELGEDPNLCLARSFSCNTCIIKRSTIDERQKEYRQLVKQIQDEVPNLLVYDPIDAFCDKEQCYGKKDVIYYGDDNHLNFAGSTLLINHFKQWLSLRGLISP